MSTVQDPAELVASVKEKIRFATEQAAVTTKQIPIKPWRDTTGRNVEDMVISSEQLVVMLPSEVWTDVIFEIVPTLDQLIARLMDAEERAQTEWDRGRELEERLAATREKINGWRMIAEDVNGVLFSARAEAAEARVVELEKALSFYANRDNWNPEPRIVEAGVSVNDRGGIARDALNPGGKK